MWLLKRTSAGNFTGQALNSLTKCATTGKPGPYHRWKRMPNTSGFIATFGGVFNTNYAKCPLNLNISRAALLDEMPYNTQAYRTIDPQDILDNPEFTRRNAIIAVEIEKRH